MATAESPSAGEPVTTIQLPQLMDAEIPANGTPIAEPRIASGFFGCWEGKPGGFTAIIGPGGVDAPSGLRRVVKCYMPGQVETQQFDLEFSSRHPVLDAIFHELGLSSRSIRVKEAKTEVYEVSANQVYSRGTMTIELTEGSLFKWPRTTQHPVVDEEVATLVNPDLISIAGRAYLRARDRPAVGVWSADLHH